jgi:hypothetical protein
LGLVNRLLDVVVSLESLVPSIMVSPHVDNGAFSIALSSVDAKSFVAQGNPVVMSVVLIMESLI